ncbi:MAG: response regulator [Cyanobacteria bacterium P01_H01_bin.21]
MKIKELSKLLELPEKQFEGNLTLNDHNVIWHLHFVQGRLIFAVDGLHGVRRWNRIINHYFPKFQLNIETPQLSTHQYWQLYLLDQGFKHQQFNLVRAKLMLREVIQECLFELSRCAYLKSEWQPTELSISRFCRTIALSRWEVQMIFNKVKGLQKGWQINMLPEDIVPTLSPTLMKPVDPQGLSIPHQYITGKYTLWDIATTLEKPLEDIVRLLLPLTQDGILEFKDIPDLPLLDVQLAPQHSPSVMPENLKVVATPPSLMAVPSTVISAKPAKPTSSLVTGTTSKTTVSAPDKNQPLIACIDDSPVLAHSLKKILATGGYRTLIIQEPMQGFSQLIEHMPSLILLDVMLPHTDGYNICRFLRDTPVFKNTPIIILTGRSKPVDRARASMAGATEFLVKPPESKELLDMIRKHLSPGEQMLG